LNFFLRPWWRHPKNPWPAPIVSTSQKKFKLITCQFFKNQNYKTLFKRFEHVSLSLLAGEFWPSTCPNWAHTGTYRVKHQQQRMIDSGINGIANYRRIIVLTLTDPDEPLSGSNIFSHTSPDDWSTSVQTLYRFGKSSSLGSRNFISFWVWGSLCVMSQLVHIFTFLVQFTWLWAPTHWAPFWLLSFLKLGLNPHL